MDPYQRTRIHRIQWKVRFIFFLNLLGQWLNLKLFGITYLVGKIFSSSVYFRFHWLSELSHGNIMGSISLAEPSANELMKESMKYFDGVAGCFKGGIF